MYMFLLLIAKTGKNPHIYRYQSFKNFIQNAPKLYMNITTYCICCKVYSSIHIYIYNKFMSNITLCADKTKSNRYFVNPNRLAQMKPHYSYSSRHLIKYLVTPALKTVSVFHLPIVRVSNDHAHNLKNYLKHI